MKIRLAHLRLRGISFGVFDAGATSRSREDRARLLAQLVADSTRHGLRIQKAALAFLQNGETNFFGTPDLVRFLSMHGVPRWTHTIEAERG